MRCPMIARMAGMAASVFVPALALAQVPAALDRVPAEAPLMVSMPSVSGFVGGLEAISKTLPKGAAGGLDEIRDLLKTPGVNADGPAAVAVMSVDQPEGQEPPAVAIIPVKNYAELAKALGGKGEGVDEVKIDGKTQYMKSLDGGFAAVAPQRELVEKFAGKPGNGAAIEKLMGANGKLAAEGKSVVVIANLPALSGKIKEGMDQAKQNMQVMGEAAAGNAAMIEMFEGALTRDGQAGVLGVSMGEKGVTLDMAGQFKEGSEWAGYFGTKGKGLPLAASLPNEPFLMAFVIDATSPGLKKLFAAFDGAQKKAGGGMMAGMSPAAFAEKADAFGFFMGETPAPMGGLFLNTAYVVRSSDPAGLTKSLKDMMSSINGQTQGGVKFTTAYNEGADKASDKPVDTWSMKMTPDPKDPSGAMVAQVQAVLFGPQGLQGFVGQTDNGLVMTYARNKDMLAKSIASLKGGEGLAADAGVKAVGENLPKDRSMEGYIGVKSILTTVTGFMSAMGGAPAIEVPENLPPVGFGGTTDRGGVRVAVHIPADTIKAVANLQNAMAGGGVEEGMDEGQGEGEAKPKF